MAYLNIPKETGKIKSEKINRFEREKQQKFEHDINRMIEAKVAFAMRVLKF